MAKNNKLCCIFCTTPYQIMTAVNIKSTTNLDFDIYIVNQFPNSQGYADRLKKTGFFNDVILIDAYALRLEADRSISMNSVNYKINSLYLYLKNCLSLEKTVKKYFNTDADYSRIYVSNNAMAGRFACIYSFKHKNNTEFIHYDDGNGSYFDLKTVYEIPLYDKICRSVIFGKSAAYIQFSKMLYFPELYYSLNGKSESIEKISISKDCDILSQIFPLNESQKISEPVIIADTYKSEEFDDDGIKIYDSLLSRCESVLGEENVIYKKHPRDNDTSSKKVLNDMGVPFEMLCYNEDFSDRILISSKSTAVFSPKLFFDQEPYIILLYKMLEKHIKTELDTDPYVEYVKSTYRNKEKILVPKNGNELNDILSKLKAITN
ncbi:MAG: hypothetical protein IKF64_05790 [Eubacterium sp.]|nr:hypothetical protein [Eubacterium sp.]